MNKINLSALKAALIDYETKRVNEAQALSEPPVIETEPYKQMLSKFINAAREAERKHALKVKTAIRILVAAALIIASLVTVVACVKPLREFFVETFEKFTRVSPTVSNPETEAEVEKTSIEEIYQITKIPEGYIELQCDSSDIDVLTILMNEMDTIIFTQNLTSGYDITVDSENGSFEELSIDNTEVLYFVNKGYRTFIWKQYGYVFTLNCPESISLDESIKIIKSLEVK
jgi:hypothetical protein